MVRARLGLTALLISEGRIDIEATIPIVGRFDGDGQEVVDQYLVAVHNHADQIPVIAQPGEPERMLSEWYHQLDRISPGA